MANGEDAARRAEVSVIMKGGQDAINEYLITSLMNLQENGCAKACGSSAIDRWTPATIGTALMGALYGAIEYLKAQK